MKKSTKKVIIILAAALIFASGTVGAFATGSVQTVFGKIFKGSPEMNEFSLYDGGNVEITTADDNLDVRLLGVFGDGQKLFSSIQITHKDGSPMVDEEYFINNGLSYDLQGEFINTIDGEKTEDFDGLGAQNYFELTDGNKALNIYTNYRRGSGAKHDTRDYRITYNSKMFGCYKLDKVLSEAALLEEIDESGSNEWTEEDGRKAYEESMKFEQMLRDNGLTKDEVITVEHEGKMVTAKGEFRRIDLPFSISFNPNYNEDCKISLDLSADTAPDVLESYTTNGKAEITPLGIYVSADCKDGAWGDSEWDWCVKQPTFDGQSKVIMNDGTVYYVNIVPYIQHSTDENDIYHETAQMDYSLYRLNPWHRVPIYINLDNIQTVVINGDTVYQK